jgi:hypothetical protein
MADRDEAVRLALLDAAKKAAIHRGVTAVSVSAVSIGARSHDFYADAAVDLAFEPDYEKYVQQLEFDPKTGILDTGNSTFVRTLWLPTIPFNVNYAPTAKGRPAWIQHPPDSIDGFLAGVGRANPYFRLHAAMAASYENAVGSIVSRTASDMRSGFASVESPGYAASKTSSVQKAEGSLAQFYVLETWIDPQNKSVWTLAVAKPNNN